MKKMKLILFVFLSTSILSIQAQDDSSSKSLDLQPEVLEKLSSSQIFELAKEKEKLKLEHEKELAEKGMEMPQKIMKEMIPSETVMILGMLSFLIFLLMLVLIPFYFNQRKSKSKLNLLGKFIDKDRDIPKELMVSEKKARSDLHRAIILMSIGVSVGLFLYLLKLEHNYWTIGIIPTIIGLGYLLSFSLNKKNNSNQD